MADCGNPSPGFNGRESDVQIWRPRESDQVPFIAHVCGGSTAGHVGRSTSWETLAPHFTARPSNPWPAGWDPGSSLPKCRIRCHPNGIGGILRHNLAKEKLVLFPDGLVDTGKSPSTPDSRLLGNDGQVKRVSGIRHIQVETVLDGQVHKPFCNETRKERRGR